MALCSRIQVDLPTSGIFIRRSRKHNYVYKVLETYRNEKGQPTNKNISIGKLDVKSGKLIPNNNYWEYYHGTVVTDEIASVDFTGYESIKSVGGTFLVDKAAESNGIKGMLNAVFGEEKTELIMIATAHMVLNGNIFEYVADWCENNIINSVRLTSQTSSVLFASITYGERMDFFKKWTAAHSSDDEHYAYDVTSFSTYANNISDAEFGYNRDGEDLPQINYGCYFGQQSGLPMFYVTYPGSIVDKSHLQYMMAYNKDLGITGVKFIMDKGFCTTDNLKFMRAESYLFLMAADNRNKSIGAAVDSVRETITSMKNRIKEGLYGTSFKGVFYSINATLHIYYQPLLAETQRSGLERRIVVQEHQLSSLTILTKKDSKPYRKLFNIELANDGSFTYRRNYTAIDEAAKSYGYLCLITNFNIASSEALEVYRRKDTIEKGFDDIKNHIDMKRLKTHGTTTADGKMFCAFIALIIVCAFTNLLPNSKELKLTKHEAFAELAKIRMVVTNEGKRLINPLTKTQRLILQSCGLSSDDLLKYVSV